VLCYDVIVTLKCSSHVLYCISNIVIRTHQVVQPLLSDTQRQMTMKAIITPQLNKPGFLKRPTKRVLGFHWVYCGFLDCTVRCCYM